MSGFSTKILKDTLKAKTNKKQLEEAVQVKEPDSDMANVGVSILEYENILQMDGDDGYTMWMYLMPLKNG